MATRKADAPKGETNEEREQREVEKMAAELRGQIETWIAAGGVSNGNFWQETGLWGPPARVAALLAIVQEYRDAGWTVEVEEGSGICRTKRLRIK